MSISLFAVTIIVNSVMIQPQYEALQPACQVVINDEAPVYVQGDCKEIGEGVYRRTLAKYPFQPVNLIVDGFDYNKV